MTTQSSLLLKVGDKSLGQIQVAMFHQGTDGIKLQSLEIITDRRTVSCDVPDDLDSDAWVEEFCF